jgi:putative DNA primase/helicase
MAAANYDDVLDQLRSAGLIVERLEVGTPRPVRCKVEGDREKRGWYSLHELSAPGGDLLIVGSFGVWRGNDNTAQKVELRKREISQEQREALRRRLLEDRKRADQLRQREAARAAETAAKAWAALSEDGDADYLASKHVGAYGLRFTKNGSAVVPLLDTAGRIHGLQFLRTAAQAKASKRLAKEYWPSGVVKKGHFHLIGSPDWCVLIAEGYATAATLHMATGKPVAVAFDAGNLLPVAEALRKRYPRTKILICADDDLLGKCRNQECKAPLVLTRHPKDCPACGKPHGYENTGVMGASAASLSVGGAWITPAFEDPDAIADRWIGDGTKRTDFNDLHAAEGLHVVRVQVEAKLSALGWAAQLAGAATSANGGEGNGKLQAIQSIEELLERFALVYAHGGAVFDRREHLLMSLSDMRDACIRRDIHRAWAENPQRSIVRIREVGFDPTERDPTITCNLWGGWPTTPKAGRCDKLLELLRYMCSGDRNADHLYRWVLRWIAYPIQHPGAKMKSTVVVHGPQGTGKNLFFEAVMKIYGEYGDVLDQSAVEDKFNDWASRKLFMIADEVVARSDLYHIKNKLKGLITGDRILINPKGFKSHWERNHLNLAFLSNEAMPVVLEEDDRRHCVIWTPDKAAPEFYSEVLAELRDGGVEALHDYLLNLDLGDFGPGTHPPLTAAKADLINLGLDSPLRFYDELVGAEIPGLEPMPGLALDWFEIYRVWCGRHNHRAAPQNKFSNLLNRKRDVPNTKKHYRPATIQKGPHAFLYMGGAAGPPDGGIEMDWLGNNSARVKAMLDEYRGSVK